MTYSNWDLAQRFADGKVKGKSHNMFIDGNVIYSYGTHWPIAVKIERHNVLVNISKYSQSTSRHTSDVKYALSTRSYKIWLCNQTEIKNHIMNPEDPIVLTKTKYPEGLKTIMGLLRAHCKGRGVEKFPMKKLTRQIEEIIFIARL